ncbi:hypothetical protein KK062_24750 [Fulvivirgaceae bacterium PWU5]|uniref:Glycosyltransferase RgtA/B/C/D-like domain-containing protein n=1 Tax=Dawidia cretensis TaxID=2782350 RepID=A0AAP2GS95_9BACT|nr:hypothetical protein [Dawidia cretensis]MBT1711476.1 hypothetical protein [Dawidia cretensis]
MEIAGLLITFLFGVAIINLLAYQLPVGEKVGYAWPVGLGTNALLMFVLDLCGVSLRHVALVLAIELVLTIVLGVYILRRYRPGVQLKSLLEKPFPVNLAWIFLVGIAVFLVYVVTARALFWPVYIYDSIYGFDFVAKAVAQEGTLHNAIFDPQHPLYSLRSLYPPLVALNFAFAYLLGFETSHVIVVIFYASLTVSLYAFLARVTTHLGAAFYTVLFVTVPELFNFASLSSSNPICAYYCAVGLLALWRAVDTSSRADLRIGGVLIMLALWTRPEAIVFAAVAGMVVLWWSIRQKRVWPVLIFGAACLAFWGSWQAYLHNVLQVTGDQPMDFILTWDAGKLSRMWSQVLEVTFHGSYYGVVMYLFVAIVFLNIPYLGKQRQTLPLLGIIVVAWLLYLLVFYQLDTDFMPDSTDWIGDAYRRGLFNFIPLMLLYCATSMWSRTMFEFIERWLATDKSPVVE